MANNAFVAVTWNPQQLIDEDTLDQINNNLLFLRNQMIDGSYMHLNNGVTNIGIKMLCGRKLIAPRDGDTATARVSFAKMFTPDSIPVITTSLVVPSGKVNIDHIINGIGQDHPNHQGFEVKVNVTLNKKKQDKLNKPVYLNWMAMGY